MRRIFLATVLAVLSTTACESHARVDSIHRMNEGIRQLQKNNASGAEKALKEAVQLDPTHAIAHMNLGKLYIKQENWVDAEQSFKAAIAATAATPNGDFHHQLGLVIVAQAEQPNVAAAERDGKYREAITAFQNALKANPNLYKAHYQVGYLYEKLDDPAKADQAYRSCIKLNGHYSLAYVALGNMYIDYGFSNIAMAVLDVGTKVNDTDAAMWNGMGRALLNLNKAKDGRRRLHQGEGDRPRSSRRALRTGNGLR